MIRRLPPTPQNMVVVASEICPNLSRQSRLLQMEKSRSSTNGLCDSGCNSASVRGMNRLNTAAST